MFERGCWIFCSYWSILEVANLKMYFDSCVSRGLVWVSYNTFCLCSCNSKWPVSKLRRKHLWLPSQTIFFNICWVQHQWKDYCFRMWSAQGWKLYQIYTLLNYWWLCGSLECASKIWWTDRLFMFKTVFQVLPGFWVRTLSKNFAIFSCFGMLRVEKTFP